jgi:hypothetical protein
MSDVPRRVRVRRPFVKINGVDLSRYATLATVDRVDETITISFIGRDHHHVVKPLTGSTDLAEIEVRCRRAERSEQNPALVISAALLIDWDGQRAKFANAAKHRHLEEMSA